MWHHPRFVSTVAVDAASLPLWNDLYAAGAEVIVNAHYGVYERFAPQTPAEAVDNATGIREFVVGTGGESLNPMQSVQPNSEVRNADTHGVLKLTLRDDGYDWEFVPIAGSVFTDSGTGPCH